MGERDNQKLGGYLADRMRGEQSTRLPRHEEAAELAKTADIASAAFDRTRGEGDEQGSRYTLMRHIENDVALRETRGSRYGWAWSLGLAGVTAVIFAAIVLGAYVFGTQQGYKLASVNNRKPPVNIVQDGGKDVGQDVPVVPEGGNGAPAPGPRVVAVSNLDSSYEALISQAREISIKNGTIQEVAFEQEQKLLNVVDQLNVARDEHNFDARREKLQEVVNELRAVGDDGKTPDNALKLRALLWAADVARMEMGNYALAGIVYSNADGLITRMLRDGASTDQETLYLQVAQTEVKCGVGYSDFLQNNDYQILAKPRPSDNGSSTGGPQD